jgi:hypothetical protein
MALGATGSSERFWRWLGAALIVAGIALISYLVGQLRRPRVAYHDGEVQFYLRSGGPISVPVANVEAFFLGQSDAPLPGALGRQQTANLVARISQRASKWLRQDVKPALGSWCNGYVTIRGTWCEPLGNELIRRLNRRLHEVQTETRNRHADD